MIVRTLLILRATLAGPISLVALAAAGCSLGTTPISEMSELEQQEQPVSEQLENARSVSSFPVYWLGDRYHGTKVVGALVGETHRGGHVSIAYDSRQRDWRKCSGVCGDGHFTVGMGQGDTRRSELLNYRRKLADNKCLRVVRKQLVLGCETGELEPWTVFRGRGVIFVADEYSFTNEKRARWFVKAIEPLNAVAAKTNATTAPLSEEELAGLPQQAIAALRAAGAPISR